MGWTPSDWRKAARGAAPRSHADLGCGMQQPYVTIPNAIWIPVHGMPTPKSRQLMVTQLEKETKGAWIIHHGRKIALDVNAPAEFPVLDETAKAAELLIRLGQSDSTTLTKQEVEAVARAAHLNPRSELPHYLGILESRRLIDQAGDEVRVLGVTSRAALSHACDILTEAGPTTYEEAAIDLAELTSQAPQSRQRVGEFISDTHKIASRDVRDFLQRSIESASSITKGKAMTGCCSTETSSSATPLIKSEKVISSLSSEEQTKLAEFDELLKRSGCVLAVRRIACLAVLYSRS